MKQQQGPELPECDGMQEMRAKIHRICANNDTHQERGSQLRALMTESYRIATDPNAAREASSKETRHVLPPNEIVAPRLEELPVELIENIAEHCNANDLGAFRCSSPILEAKSRHYFRQRFFTHRTVAIEWESLRKAVSILTNEKFGSALQQLTIIADRRESVFGSQHGRQTSLPNMHVFGRRQTGSGYQQPADPSEKLQPILCRMFERIEKLRSLRLVSSSSVTSSLAAEDNPLEDPMQFTPLVTETLHMVLSAIAQGNAQISRLELGFYDETRREYFDLRHLNTRSIELHGMGLRKLSSIKIMALNFRVRTDQFLPAWGTAEQSEQVTAEFPVSILNLVPKLEVLHLAILSSREGASYATFATLALKCKLTNLIDCSLYDLRTTVQDLERFFRPCKSIKKIHLHRLNIETTADVEETQEAIRKTFGKMELNVCTLVGTTLHRYLTRETVTDEHFVPGFPGHWVETDSGRIVR
jgi:hypothetical protein